MLKRQSQKGPVYHPTQKPIELGRYLTELSNPGDIILDNACGSGSFLVAAMEHRKYMESKKSERNAS